MLSQLSLGFVSLSLLGLGCDSLGFVSLYLLGLGCDSKSIDQYFLLFRNQCVNCICAADQHRDYGAAELKTIKELLQITEDTQPQNSKYSWSPPGLSDEEVPVI